jgi:hypothetical protein
MTMKAEERSKVLFSDKEFKDVLESNVVEGDEGFMWEVSLPFFYILICLHVCFL